MTDSFNHFDEVAQQLHDALGDVVAKTAFDIEALAASIAPVDTGFLKNTIYTRTYTSTDYKGGGRVSKKAKASGSYALPSVPSPPDPFTAYVGVGANYGIYVEMGTVHQPAQPYLAPATQACEGSFEQAVAAIESKLRSI